MICIQLNDFKYCYLTIKVLFKINDLYTVKRFQVLLSKKKNFYLKSMICIQFNDFKYWYLTIKILLKINDLYTVKRFQVLLSNNKNSI